MLAKIKDFVKGHLDGIILAIGVILISLLFFALGYITAEEEKEPIKIEEIEPFSLEENGSIAKN